ncbi:head-tail connector protein [Mesorhizobium sp. B1-1-7]|uniref:head-tail connector protein n=1 Tax=Mesorhizobium sp. B1-1-7 TaxID=2589977 RepID=UPI00112AE8BE|nr:head-tail connector protein [Mesorhizobium sp. B1-1-7]TPN43213.1 phage gp6-like head-tail connector protein [Mesorhizobium sp. B1-1-7]
MNVVVITPPSPVVSLNEAKARLNVDFDDDNSLITALIAAVQGNIDGPAGWLGRSIGVQTLEMRRASFCGFNDFHHHEGECISLRCPPVKQIVSVKYFDADGVDTTADDTSYRIVGEDQLAPVYGQRWPTARLDHDSVRIRYIAGYDAVPEPIKAAIMLHVGHLYANREAVAFGDLVTELPLGSQYLLSPYRRW